MVKTTLIITEKPQAAAKIAAALSNSTDEKLTTKDNVAYYNFQRDGKDYIVGCAVGHLYGIQQIAKRGPFPNFEVSWQPSFQKDRSAFTKRYLTTLKKLAKESDEFIVATDFDTEGEVIGWNVLRFLCNQKDSKRMKFSALTKDELERSFNNLMPTLNWGAAIAGETRHYIDWFYGINLSRGIMKAFSSTGKFRIMSIGRVQGPALKILVDREKEIRAFEPVPYWQAFLQIKDIKGQKCEVKYPKDIFKESELLRFKHLEGKKAIAETKIKDESISPPHPFDLTTLQTECYKYFGLTPTQSMRVAQDLYLAGVISYPRTSSQKYPIGIGYDKILKQLKKYTTQVKYATKTKPIEGIKEDPAHPAIYPTGEQKKLKDLEKKVYDLIVKRFISCFADNAIIQAKNLKVDVNGINFTANGRQIKEKGWMNVYPTTIEESEIPTIDGPVDVSEIRTEEKLTKPPRRYSAASLMKELEKRSLGTKATRSSIIETLFNRAYAKGKAIEITELGMKLESALEKHSPIILDEQLTKKMDEELEEIEKSTENLEQMKDKILQEAKESVTTIAEGMSKNLAAIGKMLVDASDQVIAQEVEESTMTECPVCKKGKLQVRYGRAYRRYFVACNAYPECKTTYSLPPQGAMKPARDKEGVPEKCPECGFPMVTAFKKGKSPWKLCFNPACSTNEELQKKKEEFKQKLASGEIEIVEGKIIDHTIKEKKITKKKVAKKTTKKKVGKKVKKVIKK